MIEPNIAARSVVAIVNRRGGGLQVIMMVGGQATAIGTPISLKNRFGRSDIEFASVFV